MNKGNRVMTLRVFERIAVGALVFAFAFLASLGSALAQSYTTQTIKIVVPYTAGTGPDILARMIAQKLQERWKNPVIVENRPGASANIGTAYVGRSAPDGLTLLLPTNGLVINPYVVKNSPDPFKSLTPIALLAWGRMLLVAHPSKGFKNVGALIEAAKASPGKLTYASPGVGTTHHVAMELLKGIAGIDMLHVPYKGTAGAVTDIVAGFVDTMFLPIHVAMPHVREGKLSVLGLGSLRRLPSAPDIATLSEQGLEGAEVDIWYALFAPAETPVDIVSRLHRAVSEIIEVPETKAQLARQGLDVETASTAYLALLSHGDSSEAGILH